eukprot:gene26071-46064_t
MPIVRGGAATVSMFIVYTVACPHTPPDESATVAVIVGTMPLWSPFVLYALAKGLYDDEVR